MDSGWGCAFFVVEVEDDAALDGAGGIYGFMGEEGGYVADGGV